MNDHIAIIGGGITGLCSAWFCLQHGYSVTVIDASPAARTGCSFGNAGMIVPSHFIPLAAPGMVASGLKWMLNRGSPFAVEPHLSLDLVRWGIAFWQSSTPARVRAAAPLLSRLHLASRALYAQFDQRTDMDFGFTPRGLLMLCRTQKALDSEARVAEQARQLGQAADILNPQQTARLDPGIDLDIRGAVYFPQDAHLVPETFMHNLQQAVQAAGGRFVWNARATALHTQAAKITAVQTSQGTLNADTFVLAAGVWSPRLTQTLGLRIPLQAGKGYSLTLPHPPQLPGICSLLTEARVAVTPMRNALRVGGTLELGRPRETINPNRVRAITRAISAYYPAFQPEDFAGLPVWTGLRPIAPDGLPYLGRPPHWQNLIIATGHAMMGLSLGPITGQLVAQLASGEEPDFDLRLLAVDRFG